MNRHAFPSARLLRALGLALALAAGGVHAQWFDAGRPTNEARQAVDILAGAAADALDPQDYDAAGLAAAVQASAAGPPPDPAALAPLEQALTAAMERYLSDLHFGRIDPRRIHEAFDARPPAPLDPAAHLRAALVQRRLPEAVREAAPRLPLYGALRGALARYRELERHPAWDTQLAPLPRRKLEPGQAYAGRLLLAQRLVALGDLPAGTVLPARYEGVLVEGLKAFQGRHGLVQDGVIGRATLEQLEVKPAARVRQIELTLERLRWIPLLAAPRMVVINVPEFVLRAYEVRDGTIDVKLAMKVIVGAAAKTRTPLFDEDMRYIEFSPYWNIPSSIARDETLPRLRRDPGYFAAQDLELVDSAGRVQSELAPGALDAVLRGALRIRQRPGPKNALGGIKFVFPNHDNIYLHHTPATRLFERGRRDFSHGCIRVEDPVGLALFALRDAPAWTEERIRAAAASGQSAIVRLPAPLPVVIAYATALATRAGKVHFFADLYGHDRLLDEALRRRPPALLARADAGRMGAVTDTLAR